MPKGELQTSIDFYEITFAIPSQEFGITCSLSTEEALPVVTETALRLIHTCESLSLEQLRSYFGFSSREAKAVVESLLAELLVEWDDDMLHITPYARGRFIESDDLIPRFFRIKEWSRDIVFDLMSFVPGQTTGRRLRGVYAMVELAPKDIEKESHTKIWAERSFQENFHRVYKGSRAEIYKISEVEPGERFYVPLSCRFSIDTTQGFQIARTFSDKSFDNRLEVAEAISTVLASKEKLDNSGVADFVEMFGDSLMKRFLTGLRFDFPRYVDAAHISPSEQWSGPIIPLVGGLHLARNRHLILEKLKSESHMQSDSAFWIAPQSRLWSRSRAIRGFLRDVTAELKGESSTHEQDDGDGSSVKIVLQGGFGEDWAFTEVYKNAFPEVYASAGHVLGGRVELFVVPGRLVCALYHYQIEESPIAIPIGFISESEEHIAKGMAIVEVLCDGRVDIFKLGRKVEMKLMREGIMSKASHDPGSEIFTDQ